MSAAALRVGKYIFGNLTIVAAVYTDVLKSRSAAIGLCYVGAWFDFNSIYIELT
jgi:hypothetical protein